MFLSVQRIRHMLWSSLVAAVLFIITLFVLTQMEYVYWVNDALSNGQGPYELATVIVIVALILYHIKRIWTFIRRAYSSTRITDVDKLIVAFVLWGTPWSAFSLPFINWERIDRVIFLIQILWTIGLIWSVTRLGFGIIQSLVRQPSSIRPRLLADRPIGHKFDDKDLLGRSNIIRQIRSVVEDFDIEGSFVCAVTGEWGTGKTSVLNLTMQQLEQNQEIIPVMFDPWYFSVNNAQGLDIILRRFFDALDSAIQSHAFRPNISRIINRYYKAIAPVMKQAPFNIDFLDGLGRYDLELIRKDLSKALANLGKKIVIIIDDLDRMDGLEIAYVFKLIRLCVNFDNVIYIIAFDRDFIQEQLENDFGSKAGDYIDKIVQLELPLPKIEPTTLGEIFSRHIAGVEKQLSIDLLKDDDYLKRLQRVFDPYILHMLNNIRLINHFVNRYLLTIPAVKGEVNYFDLLVLEVVRLRHPKIYDTIYQHPEYFTYLSNINWRQPADTDQQVKKLYDSLVEDLDEESKEAVLALLGSVFNSVYTYYRRDNVIWDETHGSRYREQKSAAHSDYFFRYFYLAVQEGVFSDVARDNFISKINSLREDQVKEFVDTTITELLTNNAIGQWLSRMRLSVAQIGSEQIPAVISTIANRVNEFSDESTGLLDLGDYRQSSFFILDLLRQLDPGEVETVTIALIESCSDVEFLRDIYSWFDSERDDSKFSLVNRDNLRQAASHRLKTSYIENGRNILAESHHYGGLYALLLFLEPDEYRPYLQRLLEQDGKNALSLLRFMISRGSWISELGKGTFRILNYKTIKSLVDPQRILTLINEHKANLDLSDDDIWAVNRLQEGIEAEARGESVDRIRENDHR